MEIKRLMEAAVKESAKQFPVITVVGPRQSGKTTLVKTLFPDKPDEPAENTEVSEESGEDGQKNPDPEPDEKG